MSSHIFLPGVTIDEWPAGFFYEQYLKDCRAEIIKNAGDGDVSASGCLAGSFIDLIIDGEPATDWPGVMEDCLTDGDSPLAYSERFGQRLDGFADQYRQSTVQAIHTRWWIECLNEPGGVDHDRFARMILAKRQTDGLVYDYDLSETTLRHRMKTELTMSMAMGVEILQAAGLADGLADELATDIVSPTKCAMMGYMSMEYFRLAALNILGRTALYPVGIAAAIDACAIDLPYGWCDFSIASKIDAYMGTPKRTQRDKPIHSPLTACQVLPLLQVVSNAEDNRRILERFNRYCDHLRAHPGDIPAFQMRDVPIPFGSGITPLEAICAQHLISLV